MVSVTWSAGGTGGNIERKVRCQIFIQLPGVIFTEFEPLLAARLKSLEGFLSSRFLEKFGDLLASQMRTSRPGLTSIIMLALDSAFSFRSTLHELDNVKFLNYFCGLI